MVCPLIDDGERPGKLLLRVGVSKSSTVSVRVPFRELVPILVIIKPGLKPLVQWRIGFQKLVLMSVISVVLLAPRFMIPSQSGAKTGTFTEEGRGSNVLPLVTRLMDCASSAG